MNPDQTHEHRLRTLEFWDGPITLRALPGGITNRNYLVVDARGRRFVARLCHDRPLLGIERRNEIVCQKAASALGIAPGVIHHEPGVLISEFLNAKTMTAEEVGEPGCLRRLAEALRRLHDGWDGLSGEMLYFSAFQTVRTYAETARGLGADLPDDLDELLEDTRALARRAAPFTPVLCHNDLLAANILDDGRVVRLVDWEYAGIGHPLFDLAGVSGNCGLSDAQERLLLAAYLGVREAPASTLGELRNLKATSLLREALWSAIQSVTSDLDFDYHAYTADNFAAYREARAALDEPADEASPAGAAV